MGTVLNFKSSAGTARSRPAAGDRRNCEIVIFPGVRIERHDLDLDLSHRLRDSAGRDDFGDLGGGSRPRKTS
jgi:hypothetical protein